jgi:hypothetical protein
MNLGTQQKWFHDFWTSIQVTKICQSLVQKLIYKPLLAFLEKKGTEFLGAARNQANNGPAARPNRAQRACTRPTVGKSLRSGRLVKNAPALSANRPALLLTIPRELSNATKTLQTPLVTMARSLATPALAGTVTRAQARRPEQPETSPTPQGGRHSPTGQGAASGSGWTSRDVAGRLFHEDGQPTIAASPFW